jgi:hypothetical protein
VTDHSGTDAEDVQARLEEKGSTLVQYQLRGITDSAGFSIVTRVAEWLSRGRTDVNQWRDDLKPWSAPHQGNIFRLSEDGYWIRAVTSASVRRPGETMVVTRLVWVCSDVVAESYFASNPIAETVRSFVPPSDALGAPFPFTYAGVIREATQLELHHFGEGAVFNRHGEFEHREIDLRTPGVVERVLYCFAGREVDPEEPPIALEWTLTRREDDELPEFHARQPPST